MNTSSPEANGLFGAVIVVLAIYVIYGIATKKFSVRLPNLATVPGGNGDWWRKGGLKLLILAIGVGALLWSISASTLRFSQMGSWSWDHWLQILIVWITLGTLVWMNREGLGSAAGTLQSLFALSAFVMFICVPVVNWVQSSYASWDKEHSVTQVFCPDVSAHQTRGCMVNAKWSSGIKIADGPASNGMQLCYTPGVDIKRDDRKQGDGNTTFWFFKAPEGTVVKVEYRLFPPKEACPATLPS